jgi:hypothetical protein
MFTHALAVSSLDPESVRLEDAQGRQVAGEIHAPDGDMTLTLTPYEPLQESRTYRVVLSPRVRCGHGHTLPEADRTWTFRTLSSRPFAVLSVEPAVVRDPRPTLTVRFTNAVAPASLERGRVALAASGSTFTGTVRVAGAGDALTFTPFQSLPDGQTVALVLPPGLTDEQGRALAPGARFLIRTRFAARPPVAAAGRIVKDHGLARAAGSTRDAPHLMEKHGIPPRSAPIISQYFGGRAPGGRRQPGSSAWIYSNLRVLAQEGYLGEDVDSAAIGSSMTRFKLAALVARAARSFPRMDLRDRALVRQLQKELAGELRALGAVPASGTVSAVSATGT